MDATKVVPAMALVLLPGCGAWAVHPGLASGPWLGGNTPETRVHDAVANGHDSCERAAFPPGGVLRGEIPPCAGESPAWTAGLEPWLDRPPRPTPAVSLPMRSCPSSPGRSAPGVVAFPLSEPGWRLTCGAFR